MIKPFKDISHGQRNGLASRKWVARFVSKLLGKLNLTGQGIRITPTGDGHLHFEVEDSGEETCTHAFKLKAATSAVGILVSPGDVLVGVARSPTINGRSIADTQSPLGAPVLVPPQGTGHVWVKSFLRPVLGSIRVRDVNMIYLQTTTWKDSQPPLIEAGLNLPNDVPAQINFETEAVTDATSYTALGRYSREGDSVSILDQRWITNISLTLNGQGTVFKSCY